MTEALQALIASATCPRCCGEGVLHSCLVRYVNEPAWHTHQPCDLCSDGINPAFHKKETTMTQAISQIPPRTATDLMLSVNRDQAIFELRRAVDSSDDMRALATRSLG